MAKKRGRQPSGRLGNAAASFGAVLGGLAARADRLTRERSELVTEIQGFVKQAQEMVGRLATREIPFPKFSKAKKAAKPPAPRKRRMSAAARKAISEAQKKRWAEQKGKSKKTGSSPE